MKNLKLILFAMLLLSETNLLNAQIHIGVKGGVNFTDQEISGFIPGLTPDPEVLPAFSLGIMAEIPIEGNFSFRPELQYIRKGFRVSENINPEFLGFPIPIGARADTRLNYLEMPLLLQYRYGNEKAGVYGIAGPSIGYAMSANIQPFATLLVTVRLPEVDINLNSDTYNRFELGGIAGLGGDLAAGNGKIFADIRYQYGFTNFLDDPIINTQFRNRGVNITAGYALKF